MRKCLYAKSQNRHRDKLNFTRKQRGSRDYLSQRNGHKICVSGNEKDSFLDQKINITGKIFRGMLQKIQL